MNRNVRTLADIIAAIHAGRAMGRTPDQIHADLTDGLGLSTEAACTLIASA